MNKSFDVVVVGGGPAGSRCAYKLASLGYTTAVLEQQQAVGIDTCCTGIVSPKCYKLFCPDPTLVVKEVTSAIMVSPRGDRMRIESDRVQAYVLDRGAFDKALADRAQSAGACYYCGYRLSSASRSEAGWHLTLGHQSELTLRAKALVLACGPSSPLSGKLGLGMIGSFCLGAQTEVITNEKEVNIYLDQQIFPGGFGWLVPTTDKKGLLGVAAIGGSQTMLRSLMARLEAERKVIGGGNVIRRKAMPLGLLPRSFGDNLIAVGDAAGQVKPTTGGGIYFGLLCADMASESLHEAFSIGDLTSRMLARYEDKWCKLLYSEIAASRWVKDLYGRMSQEQIDRFFSIAKVCGINNLVNLPNFSFDQHSVFLRRLVKRQPKLLSVLITRGTPLSAANTWSALSIVLKSLRRGYSKSL